MKTFQRTFSRRDFVKTSAVALGGLGAISIPLGLGAAEGVAAAASKPNSKYAGVQLGINVPYSFGDRQMSGDDVLKNCVQLGISAVELRAQPVEIFLGAPANLVFPKKSEDKDAAKRLEAWRKSVGVARAGEFRKQYETAGVLIEVVKVDGIFKMSDAELNYIFGLAKALGARAISTEISKKDEDLKRLGQFADQHQFWVGYHGHATTTPAHWEKAFSFAKFNGANVDIGHFVAGNNTSPVPFLKQHHERVTHVHLKDRKLHEGPNTPFGQGDTPIAEVLRLLRDNHWTMQATIEFEYKVPEGSTRMAEIARALKFCRDALS